MISKRESRVSKRNVYSSRSVRSCHCYFRAYQQLLLHKRKENVTQTDYNRYKLKETGVSKFYFVLVGGLYRWHRHYRHV